MDIQQPLWLGYDGICVGDDLCAFIHHDLWCLCHHRVNKVSPAS
ncbi:hypothetical protein BMF35_b0142 [Aurantiacibacter gangjinensis]|nr:hypothetical protein BMF35_b0142 [Aurantiacibacter gangjinensis]